MNPTNEIYLIFSIHSNPNIKEIVKEKENHSTSTYKIKYQMGDNLKTWTLFLQRKYHKVVEKEKRIVGLKISLNILYQFVEKLPKSIKKY